MVNIPEFKADGVARVTGNAYPVKIWKAYMDAAHKDLAVLNWDAPPAPTRNPIRLYLPGVDCVAELVSGKLPKASTGTITTLVPTVTTSTVPVLTTPTTTVPGLPVAPPTTAYRGPVVRVIDPGTTIAPTDTNPTTPVIGVDPARFYIYDCAKGIPASVKTVP